MNKKTGLDIEHINSIVAAMTEMALLLDASGNVLFANSSFRNTIGNRFSHLLTGESVLRNGRGEVAVEGCLYEIARTELCDETGCRIAALDIYRDVTEQRRMQNELMKKTEKLEEQMELAMRIQRALLPARLPQTYPFSFYFGFEPCEKVGGDLYDVFDMGRGCCAFYIADVSGHGIMAAMLTVFLKQAARAYLKNEDYSPSRILSYIYEMFNELGLEDEIYITMFLGVLNTRDGTVTYANAGHNCAPLLGDDTGVRELSLPSVPICRWFTRPGYKDRRVRLTPGARLLLYTDGLPDCCTDFRDPENVKPYLFRAGPGSGLVDALLEAVHASQCQEAGGRQDDIAILLLEHEPSRIETRAFQEG